MASSLAVARAATRPVFMVTGARGQIGHELLRELAPLGRVVAPDRTQLDLSSADSIRAAVRAVRPTVIVNAAAYTAVDRAEADEAVCGAVNAVAPGILAEEAQASGAALVHYSTDYVFDGSATVPYREGDPTGPLNVYGRTKLAGERAIEQVGGSWMVLRTSWVFGTRGNNFLRTMLRLAREREELRIVDDQVGAPTWSRMIAIGTAQILTRVLGSADGGAVSGISDVSGVYHLAAAGQTTWCEFARAILARDSARAEQRVRDVVGIPSSDYPTPAARPRWSVLDGEKVLTTFGIRLPSWESQLELAIE